MALDRMFVIDAMALAFRNHYAFGQRPMTRSDGVPTSAVFGTAMFLNKLIAEEKPQYLIAACDSKAKTFRHEMYTEYKANRSEMPEDLAAQLPDFFKLFESYGIPVVKIPGFEADDIIGTLAKQWGQADRPIYIVSGDKDFMQLVNDHTFLYSPQKGGSAAVVDRNGVKAKFSVRPDQVIDYLSLLGDASDNVPGVKGIGAKGAATLLQEFDNLDGIYANLDKVANARQRNGLDNYREDALLSRKLVTIKTDLDLQLGLADMACEPESAVCNDRLAEFFRAMEFRTLSEKVESKLASIGIKPSDDSPQPATSSYADIADKVDWQYAETDVDVENIFKELDKAPTFSFDTETTGLDLHQDQVIGFSVSWGEGIARYIPVVKKHGPFLDQARTIERLQNLMSRSDKVMVGHNLKFDLQALAQLGVQCNHRLFDTYIASHLASGESRGNGLDEACRNYLNYQKIPTTDLIGADKQGSMFGADISLLSRYACEDADFTLRLATKLEQNLREKDLLDLATTIEFPLIKVLAEMEYEGMPLDDSCLGKLSVVLDEKVHELKEDIYKIAGEEFNIASPKQLANILFERLKIHEELGLKRLKKTKTGYSTNEAVLNQLSAHPLPKKILEFRSVAKLKNTYVDPLPTLKKPTTGHIHSTFHQAVTATGRLSSQSPNLQNIPIRSALGRQIRAAFVPRSEHQCIVSADYSQIELRVLAHLSGDPGLVQAFNRGDDIHSSTASRIFGIEPSEIKPEQRAQAKAINFGIIYGMGANRLARETGLSVKEASKFIQAYFDAFPLIKEFIKESIELCEEESAVRTMYGRIRPLEGIHSRDRMTRSTSENMAVNTRVQGTASEIIKLAMIKVSEQLTKENLDANLLLQVHDELVFSCPDTQKEGVSKVIRDSMEGAATLTVPLTVELGVGSNWLEAH